MKIGTTALLGAALPIAAQAYPGYLGLLNLPRAGVTEATIVAMLTFVLVIAAALFEIVRCRYDRSFDLVISDARFMQNSARFDLDPDERRLMRNLGRQSSFDVNEMFYSLPLFEQAVHAQVKEIISTRFDDTALETAEGLLGSLRRKLQYNIMEQGLPMTSTRNISTGQSVWILGPRKTVVAAGIVVRMRELSFSIKLTNGSLRNSMFDSVVRLAFTRRADGIYGVDAPFLSFDPATDTITCRHTLDLRRNQMRSDVRVEADFSISIRRLKPDKDSETDAKPFMVRVVDLSGGGIAFITDQKLSINDVVIVCASATKLGLEGTQAQIVAMTEHNRSTRAMYHGHFLGLDNTTKEHIVKYVFEKLRELNQK